MKLFSVVSIILYFCQTIASAQITAISFSDQSANLPNKTFYSWLQKGVADMNGDGMDDIVRADTGGNFFILKQQSNGSFTEEFLGKIQPRAPLSIILGDLDNNGHPDILTGGKYTSVQVLTANSDASIYTATRLPEDSIYVQASTMVDLNNDGLLDIFVCNDDSTNAIWRNTGNGFVKDPMGFDFSSVPLNRHSGNYGIVFTDFDNDGDMDAYLSKCSRLAPTDSSDQRRINQFFVNDGGIFTDQANMFGMADSSQTWVTEFQDIDNDGDMDAFIANHYAPSRLMLNDGSGHFTDITASAGLLGTVPDGTLQGLMRDFDNDGYVDLIVSGMSNAKYFKNNGNRTFSEVDLPLLNVGTNKPLRSFVVGDLNNDGFLDIYGSYFYGRVEPDKLWLNTPNPNHFLAVNLTGTQSNRSAVGAKIILKVNGKTQVREVRAGESYGISNTLTQHFGLGNETAVESLEILWPSGQTTFLENPAVDQMLKLTEPEEDCISSKGCLPVSFKVLKAGE